MVDYDFDVLCFFWYLIGDKVRSNLNKFIMILFSFVVLSVF